jgi:hypothetical protein
MGFEKMSFKISIPPRKTHEASFHRKTVLLSKNQKRRSIYKFGKNLILALYAG